MQHGTELHHPFIHSPGSRKASLNPVNSFNRCDRAIPFVSDKHAIGKTCGGAAPPRDFFNLSDSSSESSRVQPRGRHASGEFTHNGQTSLDRFSSPVKHHRGFNRGKMTYLCPAIIMAPRPWLITTSAANERDPDSSHQCSHVARPGAEPTNMYVLTLPL